LNGLGISLLILASLVLLAALALYLYTLPGLRLLPKERRTSLAGVTTLADAVTACRLTGLSGWDLVAYAQGLAAHKFSYSRRNPWDSPARAFERGMGYCQQQALALKLIYDRLGLHSEPVYAMQCRFPPKTIHGILEPERISPHTWLEVSLEGESKYVCPGNAKNSPGVVHFEILSQVRTLSHWLQPISHLGSVLENVKRDRERFTFLTREN
jgi:hypothetical protein